MKIITLKIENTQNGKTVKTVLKKHLNLSEKLITDLKIGKSIFVNGEVSNVLKILNTDDILEVVIRENKINDITPEKYNLVILYEDEDILAVEKPSGIPTHPSKRHQSNTLANFVCGYLSENFVFRAVNRLDKNTSGIVLIAKNRYSSDILNQQIRNKEIKKEYTAICSGNILSPLMIEQPIIREQEGFIKRKVHSDGLYSLTECTPIAKNENSTLVKLIPHTGRTHQLRVHLSYIGHPILSDFLYGTQSDTPLMLHCSRMVFSHPETHKRIEITSPVPDYFIKYE